MPERWERVKEYPNHTVSPQSHLFSIEEVFQPPKGDPVQMFIDFDKLNPHVFLEILRLADDLQYGPIGMRSIIERMRYDYQIITKGDTFKLNNNYNAIWARKLCAFRPSVYPRIELRTSPHFKALCERPNAPEWCRAFHKVEAAFRKPSAGGATQ